MASAAETLETCTINQDSSLGGTEYASFARFFVRDLLFPIDRGFDPKLFLHWAEARDSTNAYRAIALRWICLGCVRLGTGVNHFYGTSDGIDCALVLFIPVLPFPLAFRSRLTRTEGTARPWLHASGIPNSFVAPDVLASSRSLLGALDTLNVAVAVRHPSVPDI